MKARLILGALFRLRNIGVLLLLIGAAEMIAGSGFLTILGLGITSFPGVIVYPAALAIYSALVIQTLNSKEFYEDFKKKEKVKHIQDLNYACLKLANQAKRNTNTAYLEKLKKVMEDKDDIVNLYFRGERGYVEERITEQTLNLVASYLRRLDNFCIRSRELSETDINDIEERINANTRKMGSTKDYHTVDELIKIIELDEKLINRLKDEKKELERISAKLDYMESTVNMLKHQALASIEPQEMLEKLEAAVNEAEALDNVLEDRRKNKLRL